MFKDKNAKGVPPTPKLGSCPLPAECPARSSSRMATRSASPQLPSHRTMANTRTSQHVRSPPSNVRESAQGAQPRTLKPILKKPTKTFPSADVVMNEINPSQQGRRASSYPPSNYRFGMLRFFIPAPWNLRTLSDLCLMSAATNSPVWSLHWQLLPHNRLTSRVALSFDIARPIEEIRFQGLPQFSRKVTPTDLDKAASDCSLTSMLITFKGGPFSWEVHVKNALGITCRNVFDAIYDTFNESLTIEEWKMIPRNKQSVYMEAWERRCMVKEKYQFVSVEAWRRYYMSQGKRAEQYQYPRRVDVLEQHTIFQGLTQPKPGGDWVLNLDKSVRLQ